MRVRSVVAATAWVLVALCACSEEDPKADAGGIFQSNPDAGSGGSNAAAAFCTSYCDALVQSAPGCEHYNDGGRCVEICKFYDRSACQLSWEAYASCMRESTAAECVLPDAGKLTLIISACHDEFNAWDECRVEKEAGICPY